MSILKQFIMEIETHTEKTFDINNRRHYFHLNSKIKRLYSDELRKLSLIEKVMNSTNENDILCSSTHYTRKRYNN